MYETDRMSTQALLEDFMSFPAPLALFDPNGRPQQANAQFLQRFGAAAMHAAACAHLGGEWSAQGRRVSLPLGDGADARTPARAFRMQNHILLLVEEASGSTARHGAESSGAGVNQPSFDALTGAWNRAHFDLVLELELSRSLASRQPLSLILGDLDQFRGMRERIGCTEADAVVHEIAQRMRKALRGADMLFRWGTDKFVVLAVGVGYRRAERVAEKLCEAVRSQGMPRAGRMTASFGVAEHDDRESPYVWLERLESAAKRAKQAGGDRVVTDRRGASDRWAAQPGAALLHLAWQEGYECGEPVIDDQHRELFALANNLIDASLQPRAAVAQTLAPLGELLVHIRRHFADEEAILQGLDYADLEQHRRAHAALVRRALQMKDLLEAGQLQVGALVEFLAQDVVAKHLLGVDAAFFPLMKKLKPLAE